MTVSQDKLESQISQNIFAGINDAYLEDNFGHYSPQELQKLNIDSEYKKRVIALQIASMEFLQDCAAKEIESWVLCKQHVEAGYSYDNI
jgi:hypothetical protein